MIMGMIFIIVFAALMIHYLSTHVHTYSRPARSVRRTR